MTLNDDTRLGRRVLLGTASNFLNKVVTLGSLLFLTPFVLSQLGADLYGLWALVGSVVAYGYLLDFGIATAVTRYVAAYYSKGEIERARSLVATALWIYTGIALLTIVLSALLALVFPALFSLEASQRAEAVWVVLLSGIGLGISFPANAATAVLKGLQRYDLANLIGTFGFLAYAVLVVIILSTGGGIVGIVAINIPLTLVLQIPTIWLIYRIAPELRYGWRGARLSVVREVASFSSSLFVINFAGQLQSKTDEIVIGAFLPLSSITPYSISRRLSETPQLLSDQFVNVLLPVASELDASESRARLRGLFTAGTRLALAASLPVGLGVLILAGPFLAVWVGAQYAQYAPLVWILVIAALIKASQWPAGTILQGMARHRLIALTSLGSGLVNVLLSILLVQRLGLLGVALGTLIPTVIENLFFVLPYSMRELAVSRRAAMNEMFLPALLPAIPMAAVLYALRETIRPDSLLLIFFIAGIGLLVYLSGYLSMGASSMERQFGRQLIGNFVHLAQTRWKQVSGD